MAPGNDKETKTRTMRQTMTQALKVLQALPVKLTLKVICRASD